MPHSAVNAQHIDLYAKEISPANISESIDLIPALYLSESHEITDFFYFSSLLGLVLNPA